MSHSEEKNTVNWPTPCSHTQQVLIFILFILILSERAFGNPRACVQKDSAQVSSV